MGLARPGSRRRAHCFRLILHGKHPADALSHRGRIHRGAEDALLTPNQAGNAAYLRRHTGQAQKHGFSQRVGRILHGGGQHKHIGVQIGPLHVLCRQMAQKMNCVFQLIPLHKAAQVLLIPIAPHAAFEICRSERSARYRNLRVRVFLTNNGQRFQQDMKALHRISAAGSENTMLPAAAVRPLIGIEYVPKGLIAMVIGDIGIDIQRVFLIPVCTANDVGQLAKGLDFQFSPLGVLRLLRQNAVMAGNIPQGSAAQNACGKAIGIVGRDTAAQTLNAGSHMGEHSLPFRGVDHSKGVVVFYAPAVNHVRLKTAKLLPEAFLQPRLVNMGRGLRHRGITAPSVDLTRNAAATIQNSQGDPLIQQILQHMV